MQQKHISSGKSLPMDYLKSALEDHSIANIGSVCVGRVKWWLIFEARKFIGVNSNFSLCTKPFFHLFNPFYHYTVYIVISFRLHLHNNCGTLAWKICDIKLNQLLG